MGCARTSSSGASLNGAAGQADGAVVDSLGGLWSAEYEGRQAGALPAYLHPRILLLPPALLPSFEVPIWPGGSRVGQVTCPCLGGPDTIPATPAVPASSASSASKYENATLRSSLTAGLSAAAGSAEKVKEGRGDLLFVTTASNFYRQARYDAEPYAGALLIYRLSALSIVPYVASWR